MKNSFILYNDQQQVIEQLSDEDAGKLFKAIYDYNCGYEIKIDGMLKIVFTQFKIFIDKDNKSWQEEKEKRSEAGKKGMASRWNDNSVINDITKNKSVIPTITVITDNVNVNDNDNIINRGAKANPIPDIINYMNTCGEVENFSIKQTFNFSNKASSNVKVINARLKENYTIEQLKDVIYNAYDKLVEHQFNGLNGKPSVQYYNPTTIFTSEKVEKYINEYKNT